ncbi:GNAT family N-acetyltransferase [Allorhizocola rhizosphaerae]|uniref:GNAT family N-acetyltransferase n=1 Tax=Allorhizocola rhizosphaerae TaxID=1872709 RepID=UPI000E3CC342|nr:GNAT family N-acetyltransferase [Allorhizocola rhizosphaerae]
MFRPFEQSDVAEAGALLAERHRRHRAAQPSLTPRYEDAAVAAEQVRAAFESEGASGAVAVRDGRMVGYLIGAPKASPVWGPNVWVESAGQATVEAETMRELYAVAATRWVDEGHKAHYVLVPASDVDLIGAWFRVGFGHQHTHGIRPPARAEALRARRATAADVPTLARLDLELPLHQSLAPTYSAGTVPLLEERLAEWESDVDNPEFAAFVVEQDGKVVGSAVASAIESSSAHIGPARPDNAAFLAFAAVFPEARGTGAGRALGDAILHWAAESGFDSVVTDWRETNLLSSRAWRGLGFADTFVRLHRLIGY